MIPESAQKDLQKMKDFFKKQPKTLVLCHANPDGDALGSLLAFGQALFEENVPYTMACIDEPNADFKFLPKINKIQTQIQPENYEAIVFLDCGAHYMTKFHESHPEILDNDQFFIINIDHHPSNDEFGEINLVWPHYASATQMLTDIFKEINWQITPKMATCLLTGLYTDTGSFMHQNTNEHVYKTAAELLYKGANNTKIAKNLFEKIPFKKLKLWGKVLQNVHMAEDNAAIVGVHENDYKSLNCTRADLNGVIDLISAMPEADYAVVLSEDGKGNVKASLRTRKDNVNVQELAKKFGGGGHVKASGFTIPKGKLKREIKWKIITDEED